MPVLLPEGLVRFLPATEATRALYVWFNDGHRYRVAGADLIAPGTVRINGYRTDVPGWRQRRRSEATGPRAHISVPADKLIPMILLDDAGTLDDD